MHCLFRVSLFFVDDIVIFEYFNKFHVPPRNIIPDVLYGCSMLCSFVRTCFAIADRPDVILNE